MTEPRALSAEEQRRKAIDDLYAVFAPDVVVEAEVEAIIARIVALDAARQSLDVEALAQTIVADMFCKSEEFPHGGTTEEVIARVAAHINRARLTAKDAERPPLALRHLGDALLAGHPDYGTARDPLARLTAKDADR